ncbi:MAG: hypothetical protein K9N49_02055 [Candidatus Marinimicrobia bacterium]|nr:hypothetical protein [Candidatus Neomarinimicrobiota bacterium]
MSLAPLEPIRGLDEQDLATARGFLYLGLGGTLFWLLLLGAVRLPYWDAQRLPTYILGSLLQLRGVHALGQTHPRVSQALAAPRRRLLWALLGQCYLAPFMAAWWRLPEAAYFLAHAVALLSLGIWTLFLVAQAARHWARCLGDRAFELESGLTAACVILLQAIPCYLGLAWAVWATARNGSNLYLEILFWFERAPGPLLSLLLLPIPFLLIIAWKARLLALRPHPLAP